MSTPVIVSHLEAAAENVKHARRINQTAPAPTDRRDSLDSRLAALQQAIDRTIRQADSICRAVLANQRAASTRAIQDTQRAARPSSPAGGGA